MQRIKNILENMSVIEKALCLNLLIRTKYSATPLLSVGIDKVFQSYNKETNMIIDSFVWNTLGLHYKDYIDTDLACLGMCSCDVIKLEQSIDKSILYYIENSNTAPD
jgi:hypothetical protein